MKPLFFTLLLFACVSIMQAQHIYNGTDTFVKPDILYLARINYNSFDYPRYKGYLFKVNDSSVVIIDKSEFKNFANNETYNLYEIMTDEINSFKLHKVNQGWQRTLTGLGAGIIACMIVFTAPDDPTYGSISQLSAYALIPAGLLAGAVWGTIPLVNYNAKKIKEKLNPENKKLQRMTIIN